MREWFESLEERRFLSGAGSLSPLSGEMISSTSVVRTLNLASLVGTYTGKVTLEIQTSPFTSTHRSYPATIVIQSVSSDGRIRGTISSPPIGTIPFNVKKSKINRDKTFTLKYNKNGVNGILTGTYVRGKILQGDYSGTVAGYSGEGTFKFTRV